MSGRRSRTINLFCPAVSKLVPLVALEEQKLDLGSIARTFGLDPATLRLNGHFISRGVDLISSSVTWKSLLSFFSSKGLTTGSNDADVLVVDGKLCKVGTKRAHNPSDGFSEDHPSAGSSGFSVKIKQPLDDVNLKKKKIYERNSGVEGGSLQKTESNSLGVKRRSWLEEINPIKKIKPEGTNSGRRDEQPEVSKAMSSSQNTCSSFIGRTIKRPREEEMILTAAGKRGRL